MHFGQIGLEQTWHFSIGNWSGCLEQRWGASDGSGSASAAVTSGAWMRTWATGRGSCADWAWTATGSKVGAGVASADSDRPSSCRTRVLTKSEAANTTQKR